MRLAEPGDLLFKDGEDSPGGVAELKGWGGADARPCHSWFCVRKILKQPEKRGIKTGTCGRLSGHSVAWRRDYGSRQA